MYRYKGSDDNTYVHYPHAYVYVESRNIGLLLLLIIIIIKFSIIISIRIIRSAHLSVTPSLDGRRRLQRDVRGAFPLVHMRVPSRPIVAQVRGDRVSCRLYRPRWNPLEPPRRAPSPSALLPLRGILNAAVAVCAEIAAEQRLTPSKCAVRSHGLPRPRVPLLRVMEQKSDWNRLSSTGRARPPHPHSGSALKSA